MTEINVNHGQIHHIRNSWLGHIFFSPGDSDTEGLLVLIHSGLGSVNEVDTNPKGNFLSFNVTTSNDRVLSVCPFQERAA